MGLDQQTGWNIWTLVSKGGPRWVRPVTCLTPWQCPQSQQTSFL